YTPTRERKSSIARSWIETRSACGALHGGSSVPQLLGGDIFFVSGNPPLIAGGIPHPRVPVAIELVRRFLQRVGAGGQCPAVDRVRVFDIDIKRAGHRSPLAACVRNHEPGIADV